MEIRHSPVVAKRLWNVVRMTLLMIRKGVVSKRKLMMDMNLMMKRGRLLRKSLSNLISHSSANSKMPRGGGFGVQEYYEFSCSNTPNPVFSHVPKPKPKPKRNHHHHHHHHSYYFPCINSPEVLMEMDQEYHVESDDEPNNNKNAVLVPKTPDFNFRFDDDDRKMMRTSSISPFSARVVSNSSSSSEEEEDDHIDIVEDDDENDQNQNGRGVDDQAEEFITRFYEQLRAQSRMQLLQ